MKIAFAFIGLLFPLLLSAQDTILFEDCLQAVVENSPRLKDKQLIDEQGRLTLENVKTNWYPDMTINGKITYQSDVVSLAIDIPGIDIPEMPHEQFGLNLDLRQTIYDGGLTKQKKKYEQASTAAAMQKVDVDLYSLKETVAGLYFSIMILQENRNTLELALVNLKSRETVLLSAIENGVLEKTEQQVISVEILRILQTISELDAGKIGALKMLSVYMDRELSNETMLVLPYIEITEDETLNRPELQWFDMQTDVLEAGKELTSVKRLPMVYAFGQAGVGRPGYNMLNNEVDGYYMIGAGLKWKVWDWNTTKREKQILETKKQVMLNSKDTFKRNISAGMQKEYESMLHYKSSLDLDDKMLKMRIDISANAASKVDNGVMSATDYLQILNEENHTRINRSTHQLLLLKALANYNLLNGTL
jgi:outer membrane protein TolC